MIYDYAYARFDDRDLDTRSQWIGRGKQYLRHGIQTVHAGRLMHDIYAHVRLYDLDLVLGFEKTLVRFALFVCIK